MYELDGYEYSIEEIESAAAVLNMSIEDYIAKYELTEKAKNSTTDQDASVAVDQASDTELASVDGSLDVPTEAQAEANADVSEFIPYKDNQSKNTAEEETKLQLKQENKAAREVLKSMYPDIFDVEVEDDQGEFIEIDPDENLDLRISAGEKKARAAREKERQYYAENPELLTESESMRNSLENGLNQLAGVDDRAKWLWAYMGVINGQEEYQDMLDESSAEIEKLNSLTQSTIGFTDLGEREGLGKITGGVAATVNAIASFGASIVTSVATGGLGLATDMISGSIKDYNDVKAKRLDLTINELIEQGEADTMTPALFGLFAYKLEKSGINGVGKAINKMGNGAVKTALSMLAAGGKEGRTEWVQHGIDALNIGLAEGKSVSTAGLEAGNAMFSKEGREAFLQGFAGGGVSVGGGRALKASFGLRSREERASINGMLETINILENQKYKKNLTKEDIASLNSRQQEIREKLKQTINDGLSVFSVISDGQIDEVNNNVDILSKNSSEINRIKKSDKYTKKAKKELINGLEAQSKEANQKIYDIRSEAERISKTTDAVEKIVNETEGVSLQKMTPKEVEEFSRNKDLKDSKGNSIDPSLVSQQQGFIYQDPKTGKQEIIISTEVAARDKAVTVAQHEFLHALL